MSRLLLVFVPFFCFWFFFPPKNQKQWCHLFLVKNQKQLKGPPMKQQDKAKYFFWFFFRPKTNKNNLQKPLPP